MIRLAVGAVIGLAVGAWPFYQVGHWQGFSAGSAAYEADIRQAAEEAREGLRDADTGTGDSTDDLDWLQRHLDGMRTSGNR